MILLILLVTISFSIDETVSGIIGPGIIDIKNDINIPADKSLEIRAGSILRFDGFCSFTCYGTITANGTYASPIIFTSINDSRFGGGGASEMDWGGIEVIEGDGECIFNNVEIAYGAEGLNSSRKATQISSLLLRFNGVNRVKHLGVELSANHDGLYNLAGFTDKKLPEVRREVEKVSTDKLANRKSRRKVYAFLTFATVGAAAGLYYFANNQESGDALSYIPDPPTPPAR